MKIVIDGIVFENRTHRGVSRIYHEILPRICDIDPGVNITILTAGPINQVLPVHARIRHIAMPGLQRFIPTRWFPILEKKLRGLVLNNAPIKIDRDTIWHSTYYTLPHHWPGRNICTVPDMIYELFPSRFTRYAHTQFRKYKKECVQQADAIICISRSTADDLQGYYNLVPGKPIYITHLACSAKFRLLSETSSNYDPPTKKGFLLYIGYRYHYKNFVQFLNAYFHWPLHKDVDVVVVGPSWNSSEQNLLKELGLEQRVHLLTQANDDDLCHLYNLALAFVYPSLYEGFGLPLLEAMSCGCPIVASRIPSSIEVAGDCAVYFDPPRLGDFVNALTTAVFDGRNAKRVTFGLERAKLFSWNKCAQMTLDIYTKIYNG